MDILLLIELLYVYGDIIMVLNVQLSENKT